MNCLGYDGRGHREAASVGAVGAAHLCRSGACVSKAERAGTEFPEKAREMRHGRQFRRGLP